MRVVAMVLVLAAFALDAFAQTGTPAFSESMDYEPRAWPSKKKKKGKAETKKDPKAAAAGPSLTSTPRSETLSIEVSVLSNTGHTVSDLTASDFKVFIDGQEQTVASVETSNSPTNFILLLDASPSGDSRIKEIQDHAYYLVERLGPDDRGMIFAFNEKFRPLSVLTSDKQVLADAIRKVKMGPGTSIYDAIGELFEKHLAAVSGRTVIVLLTDGVDTTSKKFGYESSLLAAERAGVPFYPVYFDTYANMPKWDTRLPPAIAAAQPQLSQRAVAANQQERLIGQVYLNDLIRLSGGRAFTYAEPSAEKKGNVVDLPNELRSRYTLKVQAPKPIPEQRRKIRIRVDRPNLLVLARATYFDRLSTPAQ